MSVRGFTASCVQIPITHAILFVQKYPSASNPCGPWPMAVCFPAGVSTGTKSRTESRNHRTRRGPPKKPASATTLRNEHSQSKEVKTPCMAGGDWPKKQKRSRVGQSEPTTRIKRASFKHIKLVFSPPTGMCLWIDLETQVALLLLFPSLRRRRRVVRCWWFHLSAPLGSPVGRGNLHLPSQEVRTTSRPSGRKCSY